MRTQILINTHPLETRVAFLEDGVLTDFEVEREQRIVGSLFKGRVVNVLPGMDAAFVDIGRRRNAYIYVGDVDPARLSETSRRRTRYASIAEALTVGEDLIVQVVRPPVGSKGPRVTTRLSLQGRYSVLMIASPGHLGVSRQIDEKGEQKRLRRLADRLRPLGHGLIFRTEAEGCDEAALGRDVAGLLERWEQLHEQSGAAGEPKLLYQEPGLAERVIRDRAGQDVAEIVVDARGDFEHCQRLLEETAPALAAKLKLVTSPPPLFDAYGIEAQVRLALSRRVPLPSGGHLTIDETEALTSIDVDTGSFVGSSHLSGTVLATNQEAVKECARQIRLRDLGGIIIIDFIDMNRVRDRVHVMDALEAELHRDRRQPRIVHLSPLGLVELTRRRRGLSLSQMMRVTCPYCDGLGEVCSATTVAAEARREVLRECARSHPEAVLLSVHPEVAAQLVEHDGEGLQTLEAGTGAQVFLAVSVDAHLEHIQVEAGSAAALAARCSPPAEGSVLEVLLRSEPLVPHGHPLYVPRERCLVRLPELTGHEQDPFRIRVTQCGRWFCQSETDHA